MLLNLKEAIVLNKSLEEKIIELINKDNISKTESLELIDDLYWADWDILTEKYSDGIKKIFNYLKKDDFSIEEISQMIKLYNNPDGAYIDEFSNIILNIYKRNKHQFIQALNIEKEEIVNLVYLFRNHFMNIDEDLDLLQMLESKELTKGEKETVEMFMKSYKNVCST